MFVVSAVADSPRGQVLQEDESQSALLLTSVRTVPDLLPSPTSGCADWMAGCIDRSLSEGDLRSTLVTPSAPPLPPRLWLTMQLRRLRRNEGDCWFGRVSAEVPSFGVIGLLCTCYHNGLELRRDRQVRAHQGDPSVSWLVTSVTWSPRVGIPL